MAFVSTRHSFIPMISIQHQFIFVHIPKTAGNSLQCVLKRYSEDSLIANGNKDGIQRFGVESAFGTVKHSTLADYLSALGNEAFWSKRRFTCVRNPWDRAISFYFSPHQGNRSWNRKKFIALLDKIQPMTSYLHLPFDSTDKLCTNNVDFVLRYETLHEDFINLCDFLGIAKQDLPVVNRSNRSPYLEYYDTELVDLVADRFRTDVLTFDYRYDSLPDRQA